MKVLTIYDGTIQSKTALQYGIGKVKEKGGELIILHVFQKSLFIDYDAGPRAEEMARAEAKRHLLDAENIIREAGKSVPIHLITEEGDPQEELLRVATTERPELVLTTPRYQAVAKSAACPVYVIPGTILVPVDNTDTVLSDLENIAAEARATESKVMLLGIVAIHLYSAEEKEELEQVKKGTAGMVKRIKKALADKGIEAGETMRTGYPDEEILKAAAEQSFSLIMLPAGGKTPSELAKAASILLEEPERVKLPVYLLHALEV